MEEQKAAKKRYGVVNVLLFYVTFAAISLVEAWITRGLQRLAHVLHVNGTLLSILGFIVGGVILAAITTWGTREGDVVWDPFNWFALFLWRNFRRLKLGWIGFGLGSVPAAAMGMTLIMKATGYPQSVAHRRLLTWVAATVYAIVWIPVFTWAWPYIWPVVLVVWAHVLGVWYFVF